MAKTNTYATGTAARTKLATGLNAASSGSVENYSLGDIADLYRGTKGADVASATTPDLGAATGNIVHITGTTTITGWGTATAGVERATIFDDALQLTHHATSMILLGGANITTAAGDTARWMSEGSGNWRMLDYARKSGQPIVAGSAAIAVQSVTSASTVTPTFANDGVIITAQAAALALANPTGTAQDMWGIVIRIKDNGTARAITYGTQYRAIGVTLPTTTTVSKTTYLGMVYNSADTKWDVVSVGTEA